MPILSVVESSGRDRWCWKAPTDAQTSFFSHVLIGQEWPIILLLIIRSELSSWPMTVSFKLFYNDLFVWLQRKVYFSYYAVLYYCGPDAEYQKYVASNDPVVWIRLFKWTLWTSMSHAWFTGFSYDVCYSNKQEVCARWSPDETWLLDEVNAHYYFCFVESNTDCTSIVVLFYNRPLLVKTGRMKKVHL